MDLNGTFELTDPDKTNHLYFPLVNEALMMSAITPRLHGDIKIDHHHYLTPPVSVFDLHNSRAGRNFFVKTGGSLWSAAGCTANLDHAGDQTRLEAGILWHRVIRTNHSLGLQTAVTNFIPQVPEQVELMQVKLTNLSDKPLRFTPIGAIPLYGRSADSLRDHRHVTSLLNRVVLDPYGVVLVPVMSFDERGHLENLTQYGVFGAGPHGDPPERIFPDVDSFIGEGGSLENPRANFESPNNTEEVTCPQGVEAFGGLRFADLTLAPGESACYHLVMAVGESLSPSDLIERFANPESFDDCFEHNQRFWAEKLDPVRVSSGDSRRDNWVRWVTLQPVLRRLMGNSFLPYHDYGRGGRGWRDLWQDALGLLLLESDQVADMLQAFFAGVRLDGSNATIIGSQPGEFKADRNEIPRVWMDHGVWPLKTLDVYLDHTGDYSFLLREQTYFKDHLIFRTRQQDTAWCEADSNVQKAHSGEPYLGSIFEHLLVQHLTSFFNTGEHNNLLLEGGDWNDGLDMAQTNGESVAFTAFYAGNLKLLAQYAGKLQSAGTNDIPLARELNLLLDRCFDPVRYESTGEKQARLSQYFAAVSHKLSGEKIMVSVGDLQQDLTAKSDWLVSHIRKNEWIDFNEHSGWFNGYYDNDGKRVEGEVNGRVRMTLTGQVFPIMAGVATDEQIAKIIHAADTYLLDPAVGGYRLNTDFKDIQMSLGRAFGFAFGHKENGAMFSHMAMMYAYALYDRGKPEVGHAIMEGIYQHCQDFSRSKMYPGIPEYIGPDGRGYYFYLTGSASWFLFTLITQAYGIRGLDGDLLIEPKLVPSQFDDKGTTSINSHFAGRRLKFSFTNKSAVPAGSYRVSHVAINGSSVDFKPYRSGAHVSRRVLEALDPNQTHTIHIDLTA